MMMRLNLGTLEMQKPYQGQIPSIPITAHLGLPHGVTDMRNNSKGKVTNYGSKLSIVLLRG